MVLNNHPSTCVCGIRNNMIFFCFVDDGISVGTYPKATNAAIEEIRKARLDISDK